MDIPDGPEPRPSRRPASNQFFEPSSDFGDSQLTCDTTMPTHPPALTYSAHAYDDFDPLSVEHHNTYTDPLLVDQLVDTSGQDIRDLLPKPRIMEGFGIVNFGKWCMFDLDPPILGSAPSHYLERRSRSVCWELFMQSYALTYFFNDLIQDSASRCKYIKEAEIYGPAFYKHYGGSITSDGSLGWLRQVQDMLAGGERDMKSPPEIYDDILRLIVDFSINEPDNVLDPWLPDEYVDYHEVQARRQSGIRYCSSSHKYNMRYAFADAFMKNVYPHFVTSSTLTIAEFRNLTEIAIGKTLFFAYTFHFTTTEKCLSRGWHEVGLVIIHTLTNFVERGQDAELRELRNRYIPRWQHAKTQAQSVGGGSGRRLRRALNSISRTYLHGMRCISDDFRKSRPPRTINNFVGFILLSWTVDSKGRFGIHELGTSDGFYVDLHHWIDGLSKQADADAARAFVNILWPEWRYRSAPLALDVTEATTRALGWMDRLFSTASEEEIEELPISRFLVDRILLEQNPCSGGLGDHTLAHGLVAMNLNNPLHQPQIGVYPDDDPQFDRGDYVHIYDPDPPDIYGNPGKGNWVDIDTVMVLFATFIFAVVLAFFESFEPSIFGLIWIFTKVAFFADAIQKNVLVHIEGVKSPPADGTVSASQRLYERVESGQISDMQILSEEVYTITAGTDLQNHDLIATWMLLVRSELHSLGLLTSEDAVGLGLVANTSSLNANEEMGTRIGLADFSHHAADDSIPESNPQPTLTPVPEEPLLIKTPTTTAFPDGSIARRLLSPMEIGKNAGLPLSLPEEPQVGSISLSSATLVLAGSSESPPNSVSGTPSVDESRGESSDHSDPGMKISPVNQAQTESSASASMSIPPSGTLITSGRIGKQYRRTGPRTCLTCGLDLRGSSLLGRHRKSNHGPMIACKHCGKVMKNRSDNLRKHARKHCLNRRDEFWM